MNREILCRKLVTELELVSAPFRRHRKKKKKKNEKKRCLCVFFKLFEEGKGEVNLDMNIDYFRKTSHGKWSHHAAPYSITCGVLADGGKNVNFCYHTVSKILYGHCEIFDRKGGKHLSKYRLDDNYQQGQVCAIFRGRGLNCPCLKKPALPQVRLDFCTNLSKK